MKTIKRIAVLAALALFTVGAGAQIKVGANAAIGIPMGDLGDVYSTGFGGGISGKYMINDNMAAGASFNYISLGSDNDAMEYSIMPIVANFSYYFGTEGFKPYAGLDLGVFMSKYKIDLGFLGSSETSTSDLGFAPVIGCEYAFTDAIALDANLKYNYIMTEGDASTLLGINIGIIYSIGN